MFCSGCGNQIPDGSKFCPKCGQPAGGQAGAAPRMQAQPGAGYQAGGQAGARPAAPRKSGGISPAIIIAAVVAVVAVIAIVIIGVKVIGGGNKIDLNKYAEVVFEGEDGFGTASIEVDTEQFYKDNKSKFKVDEKKMKKNLTKYLKSNKTVADLIEFTYGDVDDAIDDLFDEFAGEFEELSEDDLAEFAEMMADYYEIDPNYDLENGDKVKVTFEIDSFDEMSVDMVEAMFGFEIKADDRTVKVKGLD